MRLLTVGSLPPEWGGPARGGAATFHAALLTEFGRRDDVEVVGVAPPSPLDREIPVPAWIRPEGVDRGRFYRDLLERLRPDVVLMNHVAHTIGVTHARLDSPPPALGVIHSWHNVTFAPGEEERRRAILVTQEALGGLAAIAIPSRHGLAEGRELGFTYPPIAEPIHNPLPPHYMAKGIDVEARERRGIVYLGALVPRKNPLALVEAAALLPGLEVVLIGEGELEEDLVAAIGSLGLTDRVTLAGSPAGAGHLEYVRDMLLRARAICLPSRSESFGLVFAEALACGTPIVGFAPTLREISEAMGMEVGEPLAGAGSDEVATAIERVMARRWDRRELRRAALEAFDLPGVTDRYLGLFKQVSRPPRRGRSLTAKAAKPAVVCVLGSSRSGTSLTMRLLSFAGVHLGPEEELLGVDLSQLAGEGEDVLSKARRSNPDGHWEHYRLMRLNERILRTLGGSWREPPPMPSGWQRSAELDTLRDEARVILAESFAGCELWGWKDPRNSLTLPFWRELLPEMRCVVCLRGPLEVAASLLERDGIGLEDGIEQWVRYMSAALVNTAGLQRLVVSFESYFRDPRRAAARLARFVDRTGVFDGPAGKRLLTETIDERLWRCRAGASEPTGNEHLAAEAQPLHRAAELLATVDGENRAERSDGNDPVPGLGAAVDTYAEGFLSRLTGSTAAVAP